MFSEEIIQRVKDENDIVDVISEKVRLKKSGANYFGLCPFHNEKSPSFSVSKDKQIFKCFGCGEAGNVISFVMKIYSLNFQEAIKFLAERAKIDVLPHNEKNDIRMKEIDNIYKINVDAAKYYFSNLRKNKQALHYLSKRGLSPKVINKYGIGYALAGWNNLHKHLKTKGYSDLDMVKAGLLSKGKNDSLYDRFRNRIIYPVFDYKGKVIGFGGRVLDDSKPKYLNSPETIAFKKGTNLYGLNFALKDRDNSNKSVIMVEGYMDCISLSQHGITNVVASLGTALTQNQAKLLKRYYEKVIISFDADLAGQNAAMRGLSILGKESFDIRVLDIPDGKDPDEFIGNHGKEEFIDLITHALPLVEYKIKKLARDVDLKDNNSIIKYINKVAEIILPLNPVEQNIYIKRISEEIEVREEAIYELIKGKRSITNKNRENTNNSIDFGRKLHVEPTCIKVERQLLKFLIDNLNYATSIYGLLSDNDLILESHKKIYNLICNNSNKDRKELLKHIEANCIIEDEIKEWALIQECNLIIAEDDYNNVLKDYIYEIKKFKIEESKKIIMNQIKKLEKEGLFDESLELVKQLEEIQKRITQLDKNERR
ncbi:DNA primase [Clostridium sp. DL1XJH146]